eukprot:5100708-Alexandrium_andersonii.AAC.1
MRARYTGTASASQREGARTDERSARALVTVARRSCQGSPGQLAGAAANARPSPEFRAPTAAGP